MNRKPSAHRTAPRLRIRRRGPHTYYFYDHGGRPRKEEALGKDYGAAIIRYAEIERARVEDVRPPVTFREVATLYVIREVPNKAPRTQKDNRAELENLLKFFDDPPAPLDGIEPKHVARYLSWRGVKASTRALREKALFSAIWNWARREGLTSLPNPCEGVRAKKSKGRDVYVHDDEYRAIWDKARPELRDAMDLAYLTGQRPADVLSFTEHDIRDGALEVQQGKTRAKVRISVEGQLAEVLDRIKERKRGFKVHNTRLVVNGSGRPVSLQMLQRHWQEARTAAGVNPDLQFRDLRAKAATDAAEATGDIRKAQKQLGHSSPTMTDHYVRNRRGARVSPTK